MKIEFKKKLPTLTFILVGSLLWSLTMVKSGLIYSFGMGFWGPNGHDGVWHLALAGSLGRGTLEIPTFAGETIKNYHLGFDLLLTFLNKVTTLPLSTLYFQIIPVILAFSVGFLTYKFVLSWRKSELEAFWSTFFIYFGGSLGWIITLLRNKDLGGESTFWSQQAISTLINPPFALSLVMILLGLIFLLHYLKKNKIVFLLLTSLSFGLLIQIKAYAGILILGSLFIAGIVSLIKEKDLKILKVFILSTFISLIIFLPFLKSASKTLVFKPFWFLETMMGLSDRVGWEKFASAMTNYKLGHVWLKAILAYSIAFAIFLIGNLGTRIVGIFILIKNLLKREIRLDPFYLILIFIALGGIVLPMFFLQTGTPWNTIQFFYYTLFVAGILGGLGIAKLSFKSNLIKYSLGVLIILLTIPTTIGTLRQYLPGRPPAKISKEELEALNFLSKEPLGIVLTYPFDPIKAKEAERFPPRPLYLYESTAYVSAFSNKPTFLEDEVNLNITGFDWRIRKEDLIKFYDSLEIDASRSFLLKNKISYIYWLKGQRAKLGEGQLGLTKIFENSLVDIYKINPSDFAQRVE